jgi:hypothetical protein
MNTLPLMLADLKDIVDQIGLSILKHEKAHFLTFLATNRNRGALNS